LKEKIGGSRFLGRFRDVTIAVRIVGAFNDGVIGAVTVDNPANFVERKISEIKIVLVPLLFLYICDDGKKASDIEDYNMTRSG
jgi:hypothetical protein